MHDQSWFNAVAITAVAAVLLLGAGLFLLAGTGVSSPSSAHPSPLPEVDRTLTIAFNPASGTYDYSSTSLQVPSNTRVVFTIVNYDTSIATLAVPWDYRVIGTVGGTEQIAEGNGPVSVASLATQQISHTFTMFSGLYNVSVPIPPAVSASDPARVSFTVVFGSPGVFDWGCVAYCGTMNPFEKMAGTVDVTA